SKGIGQVMFQENIISGIIIFIGIFVSSRISAFYAILGSSIGAIVPLVFSFPLNMINIGMFGFNAVLCGIAFSNKNWNSVILATVSGVVSVFITYGIMNLGIITLTAPFVLSTWLILLLNKIIKSAHAKNKG
ncbi:partial Urea transporter, partial [uncultured bacterium]